MRIDIITVFPEMFRGFLGESILSRAARAGKVFLRTVDLRDFARDRRRTVDDKPYSGGPGMLMKPDVWYDAIETVRTEGARVVLTTPAGEPYTQRKAEAFSKYGHLVFLCGHYEGIDERVRRLVTDEVSMGDFVLTGGEIAAMAVADSVCRLVPGVLADEQCYIGESHWDGLLEYPQYTRPEIWEGREVPQVLLNGDHEKVEKWRRKQQFLRTKEKRPDLFARFTPENESDRKLFEEVKAERRRVALTGPVTARAATEEDLPAILAIVDEARASLKKLRVDQWQGPYPAAENFRPDLERGECFVLLHGDEIAAFLTISTRPEPSYDAITDGKWTEGMDYAVLHRGAVAAKYRGSGMAQKMMRFADEHVLSLGLRCIRTDTHRKNKPMQRLLRECGYRYRGNVDIGDVEKDHDSARQCYEKIIKVRR